MNIKIVAWFSIFGFLMVCCSAKLQLDASVNKKIDLKVDSKPVPKPEPKPEPEPPTMDEILAEIVAADHRPAEDKERDQYRHPVETLRFFGLEKQMSVIEIAPGQGWYTRILAPTLKDEGQLIVTSVDAEDDPESESSIAAQSFAQFLEDNKTVFGDVKIRIVKKDNVLGEPNSIDMVVSFRNNHFWAKAKRQEAKIYKAIFDVLKPGGTFGMVHHRANPDTKAGKALRKGYLPEAYVIERVTAAGFELVEKSEINVNSKDTKDYKRGVWSLPPVLAFGEKDKAKYLAIGESDRMTLRFSKPGGEEKSDKKEEKSDKKEEKSDKKEEKSDK